MSCVVKCRETDPPPLAMTAGQSTCESAKLPSYQSVGASVMNVRVVPMTRKAPVGHSKVLIPGPSSAAMGSLPDFVERLVVATSSWKRQQRPVHRTNLSSECSNQYGGFSHSGVSQELWMPTSVHPVHLAISTWCVGN